MKIIIVIIILIALIALLIEVLPYILGILLCIGIPVLAIIAIIKLIKLGIAHIEIVICIIGGLYAIYALWYLITIRTRLMEKKIKKAFSPDIPVMNCRKLYNSVKAKYKADYLKLPGSKESKFNELLTEQMREYCSRNKEALMANAEHDIRLEKIDVDYDELLKKYKDMTGVAITENEEMEKELTAKLKVFCNKNKAALKENIRHSLKEHGMVELGEFQKECKSVYGNYCIGTEDIDALIRSYIRTAGESGIKTDDGLTLIKYPGSEGGSSFHKGDVIDLD